MLFELLLTKSILRFMKKLLLASIFGFMTSVGVSQEIEVLSNMGDDISNAQVSLSHTLGELAVTDISSANGALYQGFHNGAPQMGVVVSIRTVLQGAYDETSGLQRDDLRASNFVPTTSPYVDGLTTTPAVLAVTGNDAIVDWVFVEVRDRVLSSLVLTEQSALLQRDGDVVDLDGVSPLEFNLPAGTYFVSVSHRNHLGIISDNAEMLSSNSFTLDFSDGSVAVEGGNAGSWQFGDGTIALVAGDINQNSATSISGTDNDATFLRNQIINDPSNFFQLINFTVVGYSNLDVNLDGFASLSGTNNDSTFLSNTVRNAPGNIFNLINFTLFQQF